MQIESCIAMLAYFPYSANHEKVVKLRMPKLNTLSYCYSGLWPSFTKVRLLCDSLFLLLDSEQGVNNQLLQLLARSYLMERDCECLRTFQILIPP